MFCVSGSDLGCRPDLSRPRRDEPGRVGASKVGDMETLGARTTEYRANLSLLARAEIRLIELRTGHARPQ